MPAADDAPLPRPAPDAAAALIGSFTSLAASLQLLVADPTTPGLPALAGQLRSMSSAVLLSFDDRSGLTVTADALDADAARWSDCPAGPAGSLAGELSALAVATRALAAASPAP